MKKSGVLILSILLLIIVTGCGKAPEGLPQQDVVLLSSEETKAFVHSLPNIRDAITSMFGSWNIFIDGFVADFDAKKTMVSPSPNIVSQITEKAGEITSTIDNMNLILADFGRKKSGVNINRLSSSDSRLVNDIDSKLSAYANNKAKFDSCVGNIEKYAEFVELTVEREKLIADFTKNMNNAGNKVDANKFDSAITLGKSAKSNLLRLKAIDSERSKMGIIDISGDVLMSWDLHSQAMDILLSLWNDLKVDNMNAAMDKAQEHYNTFSRANKYGETEPPVADQATAANVWLDKNIGSCKGLV